jgi:hypothetical protein
MTDQQKGVSVVVPPGKGDDTFHPEGTGVRVADGHLFVLRTTDPNDVVAAYAPNAWLNVKVKK